MIFHVYYPCYFTRPRRYVTRFFPWSSPYGAAYISSRSKQYFSPFSALTSGGHIYVWGKLWIPPINLRARKEIWRDKARINFPPCPHITWYMYICFFFLSFSNPTFISPFLFGFSAAKGDIIEVDGQFLKVSIYRSLGGEGALFLPREPRGRGENYERRLYPHPLVPLLINVLETVHCLLFYLSSSPNTKWK